MLTSVRRLPSISSTAIRAFSVSSSNNKDHSCKLLVVGGGSGGCTIANKFARRLGKDNVIVLEPSEVHYYQPLFTLIGGGIKRLADCRKQEQSLLPSKAIWLKDVAESIDPRSMSVKTKKGDTINYEYIVIAVGLKNDYNKVPGLQEALDDEDSGVSTIYSPDYCEKTWSDLKKFKGGEAIFTYPSGAIKCPGAPQKIAYLADAFFRKTNIRSKSKITFNTNLPVIFGVKKYADALQKVVEKKDIKVNYTTLLKEIKHDKKEAVFVHNNQETTFGYDVLHVTPPMSTPDFLTKSGELVDESGYLDVDMYTLQHNKYPNVYGIGDCTSTPNSKTAAAIAKQSYVVERNLLSTMKTQCAQKKYDGYGACPLVTGYHSCIIAEFTYGGVPRETLPINQANENILAFYMKKDLFPFLYWHFMLRGYYHGPELIRSVINPLGN